MQQELPAKGACPGGLQAVSLFAETFESKFVQPVVHENVFTELTPEPIRQADVGSPGPKHCETLLGSLNESSATGPDDVSTRVLRKCAKVVALPLFILITLMLQHGEWPDSWREHWMLPLHKRKSVHQPANYRGIHLTSQQNS